MLQLLAEFVSCMSSSTAADVRCMRAKCDVQMGEFSVLEVCKKFLT